MVRRRNNENYDGYIPYLTVADKKAQAAEQVEKLREKDPDIAPVVLEGRTIAKSWWGRSWNLNLERYADYEFRLDRGRSYLRCGCLLDLKVKPGRIEAIVAGSNDFNYTIIVSIAPLKGSVLQGIVDRTEHQLDSLSDLLAGKFPKTLQEVFFDRNNGLFPHPQEISFNCDCPDWADMCKHVAATLYGVGARLDDDPSLFFTLRHIDQSAFINQAVTTQTDALLAKADAPGAGRRRRIDSTNVASTFGVKLDTLSESPDSHQTRDDAI